MWRPYLLQKFYYIQNALRAIMLLIKTNRMWMVHVLAVVLRRIIA